MLDGHAAPDDLLDAVAEDDHPGGVAAPDPVLVRPAEVVAEHRVSVAEGDPKQYNR